MEARPDGVPLSRDVDSDQIQVLNYSPEVGSLKHKPEVYNFYRSCGKQVAQDGSCCHHLVLSEIEETSTIEAEEERVESSDDIPVNHDLIEPTADCVLPWDITTVIPNAIDDTEKLREFVLKPYGQILHICETNVDNGTCEDLCLVSYLQTVTRIHYNGWLAGSVPVCVWEAN